MTINAIRFRAQDGIVVLQVGEEKPAHSHFSDYARETVWRDAKVEDLLEVASYTSAHDYSRHLIGGCQTHD